MPKFSKVSLQRLETCHADLQKICKEVIKYYDISILYGHRNRTDQDQAFEDGASKLKYPKSKHNQMPSLAVDIAPYPIAWEKEKSFYYLAGMIKAEAEKLGVKIRWGGDWDGDGDLSDQTFFDLVHYEIVL